ncbi:MAG: hypothetical protein ABI675_01075 [Chitinophagaceae bacterium]
MYVKARSYYLKKGGQPIAYVMIKINLLTFKYKAEITLTNGNTYELFNQWAIDTEFDREIELFVHRKILE